MPGDTVLTAKQRLPTAEPSAAGEARDVIFAFSYVTWIGAWRRGLNHTEDRLAQTLLTHPRVRRLIIANPYRSLPIYLARSVLGHDSVPSPANERISLHQPLRLRRRDPTRIQALERAYSTYDRRLEQAARRCHMERPVVIAVNPMTSGLAPLDWADAVTFYASDDWSAAPAYRKWWPGYERAYARIRDRGRRVCAVSEALMERIAPTGPHAVVPNGVHPDDWMDLESPPSWFTSLPRPRLLYVGTLDSRLDIARIREAASSFRTGSVVLVGPAADPTHLRPLRELRNVHLHPRIGRSEVARVIAGADVCLIPHTTTRFTSAMSPLKAYEYLAAGRPIAASDLPPLRGIDRRLVLAPDESDFSQAVTKALELGPAAEDERRSFIASNSWQARHEQLLDVALG